MQSALWLSSETHADDWTHETCNSLSGYQRGGVAGFCSGFGVVFGKSDAIGTALFGQDLRCEAGPTAKA